MVIGDGRRGTDKSSLMTTPFPTFPQQGGRGTPVPAIRPGALVWMSKEKRRTLTPIFIGGQPARQRSLRSGHDPRMKVPLDRGETVLGWREGTESFDCKALEKKRETNLGLCPGQPTLTHSVLRTRHPRRIRMQKGLELGAIQMPQYFFLAMIVEWAFRPALRTRPLDPLGVFNPNVHTSTFKIQFNLADRP